MSESDRRVMTWTAEQILSLRALWEDGLSAREIGERIGKTRLAVIGKADRLQLHYHDFAARYNPHLRGRR